MLIRILIVYLYSATIAKLRFIWANFVVSPSFMLQDKHTTTLRAVYWEIEALLLDMLYICFHLKQGTPLVTAPLKTAHDIELLDLVLVSMAQGQIARMLDVAAGAWSMILLPQCQVLHANVGFTCHAFHATLWFCWDYQTRNASEVVLIYLGLIELYGLIDRRMVDWDWLVNLVHIIVETSNSP